MQYARVHLTLTFLLVAAGLLVACGTTIPVKPGSSPNQVAKPESGVPPPRSARETTIDRLLAEADAAMQQGRLTQPAHDNAYDRFRAVQLLEPGNKLAQAGLDSILLAYVDRIQRGISAGLIQAAAAELRLAQSSFPEVELLAPLAAEIDRRAPAPPRSDRALSNTDRRERVVLPAQPLAQKSEEVKKILIDLAQRVRQSDEVIMIYARSDAEGRWIYKTMKDSVDEYRIRGDIRITREPAVELLPPLE